MQLISYIDFSNLLIGGQKLSAKRNQLLNEYDEFWRVNLKDFKDTILEIIKKEACLKKKPKHKIWPLLFGSYSSDTEKKMFDYAQDMKFKTILLKRQRNEREMGVDIELAVNIYKHIHKKKLRRRNIAVIISGDGDFANTVKYLINNGYQVYILAWKDSFNSKLKDVVGEKNWVHMDDHFDKIGFREEKYYLPKFEIKFKLPFEFIPPRIYN